MGAVMFKPLSVVGSILAGLAAGRLFEYVWSRIDDEAAPGPEYRDISIRKLGVALAIQGAIVYLVRGAFDRGARNVFYRGTRRWPGEERPEEI